ncbi:MAG TPA: hypothetical protein VED63_10475, partial [Acidimicrobiales bacterium]|nr:hypothetical protein [Acidimicrobiales bacterium]
GSRADLQRVRYDLLSPFDPGTDASGQLRGRGFGFALAERCSLFDSRLAARRNLISGSFGFCFNDDLIRPSGPPWCSRLGVGH